MIWLYFLLIFFFFNISRVKCVFHPHHRHLYTLKLRLTNTFYGSIKNMTEVKDWSLKENKIRQRNAEVQRGNDSCWWWRCSRSWSCTAQEENSNRIRSSVLTKALWSCREVWEAVLNKRCRPSSHILAHQLSFTSHNSVLEEKCSMLVKKKNKINLFSSPHTTPALPLDLLGNL